MRQDTSALTLAPSLPISKLAGAPYFSRLLVFPKGATWLGHTLLDPMYIKLHKTRNPPSPIPRPGPLSYAEAITGLITSPSGRDNQGHSCQGRGAAESLEAGAFCVATARLCLESKNPDGGPPRTPLAHPGGLLLPFLPCPLSHHRVPLRAQHLPRAGFSLLQLPGPGDCWKAVKLASSSSSHPTGHFPLSSAHSLSPYLAPEVETLLMPLRGLCRG